MVLFQGQFCLWKPMLGACSKATAWIYVAQICCFNQVALSKSFFGNFTQYMYCMYTIFQTKLSFCWGERGRGGGGTGRPGTIMLNISKKRASPVGKVISAFIMSGIWLSVKGKGNFQINLSWCNSSPPLFQNFFGEKAHNAPEVKLLALKYSQYGSCWWLPSSSMALPVMCRSNFLFYILM